MSKIRFNFLSASADISGEPIIHYLVDNSINKTITLTGLKKSAENPTHPAVKVLEQYKASILQAYTKSL